MVVVTVVVSILWFFFWVAFDAHFNSVVRKEFKLLSPGSLSHSEVEMIRPMVNNVLEKLKQEKDVAKAKELILSGRTDITPDNAEQAITDLRLAQKAASVARKRLYEACRAANYVDLIPDDLSFCK